MIKPFLIFMQNQSGGNKITENCNHKKNMDAPV